MFLIRRQWPAELNASLLRVQDIVSAKIPHTRVARSMRDMALSSMTACDSSSMAPRAPIDPTFSTVHTYCTTVLYIVLVRLCCRDKCGLR